MAIADIAAYAHLSEADITALGYELDAIRSDIEESLGEKDAAYIRRTIKFQRTLDVAAQIAGFYSSTPEPRISPDRTISQCGFQDSSKDIR